MANQYFRSTHADEFAGPFDCDAVSALVTAGAFVALADGRVQTVERDEVVHYIHRRRLARLHDNTLPTYLTRACDSCRRQISQT